MSIEVGGVSKSFGAYRALDDVTLSIGAGELVALLGPSGSGKTTLLRLMAGLESPDRGQILLDGAEVGALRPRDRRVGFVFQHYALFGQMTVFDNVAFGLQVRPRALRPSKAAIRARVEELLRLVQLEELAERRPAQLSGGQRQRVAVARALAVEPRVLLLDEPFGALDLRVRQELRRWLRQLQAQLGLTTVLVTHDQEEALEVADRVAVLQEGRIAQIGTPAAVYDDPASPFVCGFLGDVNRLVCRVDGSRGQIGELPVAAPAGIALPPGEHVAYARPHDLLVRRPQDALPGLLATIRRAQAIGPTVRLELARRDNGDTLEAHMDAQSWRESGLLIDDAALVVPRRLRVYAPEPVELLIAAERVAPAPSARLPV